MDQEMWFASVKRQACCSNPSLDGQHSACQLDGWTWWNPEVISISHRTTNLLNLFKHMGILSLLSSGGLRSLKFTMHSLAKGRLATSYLDPKKDNCDQVSVQHLFGPQSDLFHFVLGHPPPQVSCLQRQSNLPTPESLRME